MTKGQEPDLLHVRPLSLEVQSSLHRSTVKSPSTIVEALGLSPVALLAGVVLRLHIGPAARWYVIIELDFDARQAADAFVTTMCAIWPKVEETLIVGPQVRIVDCVELRRY